MSIISWSDATIERILYIFSIWLCPIFCFIVIFGNILSIRVLTIQGLDKSYNVLLVCLAFGDSTTLLAYFLYGVLASPACPYLHDNTTAYFLLYQVLHGFYHVGVSISFMVPLFLTGDRIIAVWFPCTLYRSLTAKKTWIAMTALFFPILFIFLYLTVKTYDKSYLNKCGFNSSNAKNCILKMSLFTSGFHDSNTYRVTGYVILGPAPVSLVLIGCFAIIFKIIKDSRRRKRKASEDMKKIKDHSFRITLTLLAVCLLYGVISITIMTFVTEYFSLESCDFQEALLVETVKYLILINQSANPIIYIVLNPRFRKTIIDILRSKKCCFGSTEESQLSSLKRSSCPNIPAKFATTTTSRRPTLSREESASTTALSPSIAGTSRVLSPSDSTPNQPYLTLPNQPGLTLPNQPNLTLPNQPIRTSVESDTFYSVISGGSTRDSLKSK